MIKRKRFLYFWAPVLFYAGAIFIFSSRPFFFPPGLEVLGLDKLLHVVEYGVLGFLLGRAFLGASPLFFQRSFQAWAAAIAICYGFTDEIHQFFVPMRQSSSLDLVCDGFGAILAQLFFNRRGR